MILMISVSTKMPYDEVREISLRSGKNPGRVREVREDENRKRVGTLYKLSSGFREGFPPRGFDSRFNRLFRFKTKLVYFGTFHHDLLPP